MPSGKKFHLTDVDFNRLQTSFLQNMLFVSVVEYQLILCEFAFEAAVVDRMRSEISAVTFRGFSLVGGRIVFLPTASHSSRKDEGKHKDYSRQNPKSFFHKQTNPFNIITILLQFI